MKFRHSLRPAAVVALLLLLAVPQSAWAAPAAVDAGWWGLIARLCKAYTGRIAPTRERPTRADGATGGNGGPVPVLSPDNQPPIRHGCETDPAGKPGCV